MLPEWAMNADDDKKSPGKPSEIFHRPFATLTARPWCVTVHNYLDAALSCYCIHCARGRRIYDPIYSSAVHRENNGQRRDNPVIYTPLY